MWSMETALYVHLWSLSLSLRCGASEVVVETKNRSDQVKWFYLLDKAGISFVMLVLKVNNRYCEEIFDPVSHANIL